MRCRYPCPGTSSYCGLPLDHAGGHRYTIRNSCSRLEEELRDARRHWAKSKGVCPRKYLEAAQFLDSVWWQRIKQYLDRTY